MLGGTYPHIELIHNLKNRGYYTVLIDYAANPVARPFADEHIVESSMDKEKVLEIALAIQAELVITTCSDQANVTACYVAEKLGLPAPYSYETSLNVTDKERMKTIMLDNDIPTSNYRTVDVDFSDDTISDLPFPLIVKPTDSYGSKGVRVVESKDDLRANVENAIRFSKTNRAIIEEFIVGKEIGIDCFVKNKSAEVILTKHRLKIQDNEDMTQQIFACIWPADYSSQEQEEIQQIANKIAQVFELDNTPLMIQAIATERGIKVIEFGARIGGGNSYSIIKLSTGFDIIDAAVDSFLNRNVELTYHAPSEYFADVFLYTRPSKFGRISAPERDIEHCACYKEEGSEVGADLISSNRVGSLILRAKNRSELLEKINDAIDRTEVYGLNDNPIMRRELYDFS